jgi:hypothetical protein
MQRFQSDGHQHVETNLHTSLMDDLTRRSEALRGYL